MTDQTAQYLSALDPTTNIFDFRAFHDRERGRDGIAMRGTLAECLPRLQELNTPQAGYGIHVMLNATDGLGRTIQHVRYCRTQLTDLDKGDVAGNYERISRAKPNPHAIVNTSPGKFQFYHYTTFHADKQLFTDNQRRLAAEYGGDPQFIDVAHTARLPGFYHHKENPFMVTLYSGPAWGTARLDPWAIAAPLMHHVVSGGMGDRRPLGEPSFQAPSIEWLSYALFKIDPNSLGFLDWIAVTAAFKAAGWSFGEAAIFPLWSAWCAQYRTNDNADNLKQWRHINETQSGWKALVRQARIEGDLMAAQSVAAPAQTVQMQMPVSVDGSGVSVSSDPTASLGSFLTPHEQSIYFDGCYLISSLGRILTPSGRLMDTTKFNAAYGGKTFQLSNLDNAKTTNEAWQAATRGLTYNVPRVDHLRFLPKLPFGAIEEDELGRKGVNTYRPIKTVHQPGDVSIWLDHLARVLPMQRDRDIINSFMAYNVQFPGEQIGWAPVIQSAEGAGKTAFQKIMIAMAGRVYVHSPKAEQLVEGGGKFNAWIQNKLLIFVNEIRVNANDKRDLVEILKPLITDEYVETERKGIDQEMFDNCTNWLMFTNYRDAIPVNSNSRRFCVIYSALQSEQDILASGMDGRYFNRLYQWLKPVAAGGGGGASAVVEWLRHYEIPDEFNRGTQATRAPRSTSYAEVLINSRNDLETIIAEAAEAGLQGFRGGWLSSVALAQLTKERLGKTLAPRMVGRAIENMGYHKIGRAFTTFYQEGGYLQPYLYNLNKEADIKEYGIMQGYTHSA